MRAHIKSILLCAALLGLSSCASLRIGGEADNLPLDAWYFESVTFEIAPVTTSAAPDPAALALFRSRLHSNRICHRDNVRFIIQKPMYLIHIVPWNGGLLAQYETRHRTIRDREPDDRHLIVFVPYIMGPWVDIEGIKQLGGVQYSPTAFAIFKGGAGKREAAVLLHEFGHLIGMVKNKDRENHDDDHRHHCANKRCVMFFSAPYARADFDYYCQRYIQRRIAQRARED